MARQEASWLVPCPAIGVRLAVLAMLVDGPDHLLDDEAAVADNRHVRPAHLAELGGVDVDMDDLGLRREARRPPGHPVVEAAAEGDQQIGLLHGGDGGVVAVHARHAEAQRVVVGEGPPSHQGGDHVDPGQLRQLPQGLGGPGLEDPAAGVDDRAPALAQKPGRLPDHARVAAGGRPVARQRGHHLVVLRPRPLGGGLQDVLRHVHQHRPRAARGGDVERLADDEGDLVGVHHQLVVLGDRTGDTDGVALLEGVRADARARHLTGHRHQRDGVHVGVAQRGHQVGGAGAARHHGHPGAPGHVGVPLGHVAGSLLVPDEDVPNGRVEDGVVGREDGAARQAEDDLHPFHLEALDEGLGPGQFHARPSLANSGWERKRPPGWEVV